MLKTTEKARFIGSVREVLQQLEMWSPWRKECTKQFKARLERFKNYAHVTPKNLRRLLNKQK